MTVESATTINQLDATLPGDTDPLAEGKNHFRLIKAALKATFPNVTGPVTATHTDLSSTPGVSTRVTALEASVVRKTGAQSMTGPLQVTTTFAATGSVDSGAILQNGAYLVPAGIITMWYGLVSNVPAGWRLCDGTGGTPDLRDKFILGAGSIGSPYATGGAAASAITTASAGSHSHGGNTGYAGGHGHVGLTDVQGYHGHTGVTGSTGLSVAQMPSHTHVVSVLDGFGIGPGITGIGDGGPVAQSHETTAAGSGQGHSHEIVTDGGHYHNVNNYAVGDHSHTVGTDGIHSHTATVPIMPPFICLCFIMKT